MTLRLRSRPTTVGSSSSLRPSTERRFAARARRRRLLSLRPLLVALAVLAVVAAGVWLVFGSTFLAVQKVTVRGEHRLKAATITGAAQVPLEKPMALLDVGAARRRVAALPAVASVTVERSWPSSVTITVVERTPAAVVARPGKPFALVDPTGVLFADVATAPAGLSVLSLATPGPADPATKAALDVVAALPATVRSTVTTVRAPTPASVTLDLAGGLTVIWGDATNSARKAQTLAALLQNQAHPVITTDKRGRPITPPKATVFDVSAPGVATSR